MKKRAQIAFFACIVLIVWGWMTWFLGTHEIAVLHPKGMIGLKQRDLLFTAARLMLIVVIPAYLLTIAFAWIYREKNEKAKYTPDWSHSHLAETIWWGIPFVIIIFLGIITWRTTHELSPFKPIETGKRPLSIQAVALQWKWLFIYPEQGIATVNFVQFPEQTPLAFEITADAPMNSFWIPQLGGQIYAMPAMRTKLHLIADQAGDFRGRSANLSGEGFAGMFFTARASSEKEFADWVSSVKSSGKGLDWQEYEQLVRPSSYDSAKFYKLSQEDLFDQILMQYMAPR